MTLLNRQLKHKTTYIPAFGYSFLTPFYDYMVKYAARESAFKPRLVRQAGIEKCQRILDLGCGTATLTILIKKATKGTEVVGVDADPKVLEIARAKVAKEELDIALDRGIATELPYPEASFDRVLCSMVLHHLTLEDKLRALKQVFRVLKPEGELHLADFGKPHNSLMYLPSLVLGRLERASDNVKGLLPKLISAAGFEEVEQTTRCTTIVGTIDLYKARKPGKASANKIQQIVATWNKSRSPLDEEEQYYSLMKKYARMLAPFYDGITASVSKLRDRVADFADPQCGSRILDVATGTGKQAFAFARKGYDVVGIDLSEDMLNVARGNNRHRNLKLQVADAADLPFENCSFDVSSISFALHDMIPSVREKALKEMVRVTKPNGTVMIVDYALPKNKMRRFLFYNIVRLYEPYYIEFIKSDLEALVEKSGIKIREELQVLAGAARVIKGTKAGDIDA